MLGPFSGSATPRVYMYDLPGEFQNLTGLYNPTDYAFSAYGAEKQIPEVSVMRIRGCESTFYIAHPFLSSSQPVLL